MKDLTSKLNNKKDILNTLISLVKLDQDKVFFKEYFKVELE